MLVTLRGQRVTLNILFFQQGQVPDISLILYLCNTSLINKLFFFSNLTKRLMVA